LKGKLPPQREAILHRYLRVDPEASTPLAAQLSEQLLWLIASGEIEEGEHLPAVRQLAAELDINYHTVRAAYQQLKAQGVISTRQGRRAEVLPHDRLRWLSSAPRLPTFTLGVLVPNYSPYHARFLQGLEQSTAHDPWLKFICDTNYYSRHVGRYMGQLLAKNVDGIVVTHFEKPDQEDLRSALSPAPDMPPIVYADSPHMPGPSVGFDREHGAFEAVLHLIEHGYRSIALITPNTEWSTLRSVYAGYQRALVTGGLPLVEDRVVRVPTFAAADGAGAAEQLLADGDPPEAIFAAGDMLAIGAMRRFKEHGLKLPDDIAVVGYGEIDLAELIDPPLTTVALSPTQMGHVAMRMLRQSIDGEEVNPREVTLPARLVLRRSCGCPAAGDGGNRGNTVTEPSNATP
jgi:DNA-binding LacI/PurR family transcriptional regulator